MGTLIAYQKAGMTTLNNLRRVLTTRYQNIIAGEGISPSLLLLLLALSTVFIFGNDRGHFYRAGNHDWLTSQHLTQAVNLSPDHNFLLFISATENPGGDFSYITYARWPIGSYALVKLATLPFDDDFSARIYATRIVMLLFFAGSAALAYLALRRLIADHWIALTATLLAFSSFYSLYYADAFAPDVFPGLFGVILTFHGMVVFVQERRFAQLLIKSCLALLLCWQVYALLLPFIIFGLASELIKVWALASDTPHPLDRLKRLIVCLARSRYMTLGVATLLFGIAVLSFNLTNEYLAFDGEYSLAELPTIKSVNYRIGLDESFNAEHARFLEWDYFLENQIYRIGRMALPFSLSPYDNYDVHAPGDFLAVITGGLALIVCFIGLIYTRNKMLLATLVISGFFWALPLRHFTSNHDFQAMFYIGIPLTAFIFVMLWIRKTSEHQLAPIFAVGSLFVFVFSAAQMAGVGHDYDQAIAEFDMMEDLVAIRDIVNESSVFIPHADIDHNFGGAPVALHYFLQGTVIGTETYDESVPPFLNSYSMDRENAAFVILPRREERLGLLTPYNRRLFLYDRAILDGQIDRIIREAGDPVIRSDFDVYLADNRLIYAKEQCAEGDTAPTFFLHIDPIDANDLPDHRKQYGFDNLDFNFEQRGEILDGDCLATVPLPDYDIAAIRTGQYVRMDDGFKQLWEGEVRLDE